jgi:sugar lactone lactonase YvrE
MRAIGLTVLVLVLAAGTYLGFAPIPVKPQAWTPDPVTRLEGALAGNTALRDGTTRFAPVILRGPEDVAVREGWAYTGLANGVIMKVKLDGSDAQPLADTGGRPLGLQFDAGGNLIVADAKKGLLSVAPDGTVTVLADRVDAKPMVFVDDLDIAADGTIWFSDASTRFGIDRYIDDLWEGSATGRLLAYDPKTKTVRVALEDLRFANGVAIAPDQSFVLVNETAARRIRRLWLTGPDAGKSDFLITGLPGFPDNLSAAPGGGFWVALPSPANPQFDDLMPRPFLRAVMYRLTKLGILPEPVPPTRGWAVKIGADGRIVKSLMDPKGEIYHTITSVNEADGELFFGSIAEDAIGRMRAP